MFVDQIVRTRPVIVRVQHRTNNKGIPFHQTVVKMMAWCSKKPGHLTAGQSICFLTSPVRVKGGGYEAGMMLFALFLLCARRNEWTFCTFFLELPRDVDPPPLTYPRIGVQSTVHPFGLCISIRIPYFFCKKWIRELVIKSWHEGSLFMYWEEHL